MRYPLATSTWGEEEKKAAIDVINSEMCTMGELVKKYEKKFANYTGSRYCVMVNSGSSANLLMIASLFYHSKYKLNQGDEIIVPAVSWPTTYYPLYQYGLKVKFVDIDVYSLNFNLKDLDDAISDKTKLILAVNLLGNSNEFSQIKKIISDKDILLLEDNCESLGAYYYGRQAGTFGLMGSYSTFFSHHMSTMEGGCIVTDNEELYHILLSLRAHGWTRNLPENNLLCIKKNKTHFHNSFNFILPGYNLRPLEVEAAIGIEQLKKLPGFIKQRRKNAEYFKTIFRDDDRFLTQKEIGESSWFGFSMIFNEKINRDKVADYFSRKGIECRPIVAGNFTRNRVVKLFDFEIHGHLQYAEVVDKKGIFVGNHHYDISENIDYLSKILNEII